ncbi:hypothetical protein [Amycolatopsis samaneae]|uniref:PE family protein n=1 Tax=Amycolatopsis samaneae TaxID=664691 RepID=A0ABW5GL81_9PSEU
MTQPAPEPGNWLSDVQFSIVGDHGGGGGGAGAAPPSAPGFTLNAEEARTMLRKAEGILDDLAALLPKAERLCKMRPPADDPASNGYNSQLVGGAQGAGAFQYGAGHIKREFGYLSELAVRLRDALGVTEASDRHAKEGLARTAGNGGLAG